MPLTFEGVYEGGVLKPRNPLPVKESAIVRFTLEEAEVRPARSEREIEEIIQQTYGIVRWNGSHEDLRRLAEDEEFGRREAP